MVCLDIAIQGHLLVAGGQASESGAHLATARRLVKGRWVPYIPATALRGAVRIQLEALLKGGGFEDQVVGPYPFDIPAGQTPPPPSSGMVARLFGYSGPNGKRNGSGEGAIRFSDALPMDVALAEKALRVRPGLELENFTSTAEDQKLYFREVAEISAYPLVFRAHLMVIEPERLGPKDLDYLQAAVEATDAIGAGKAKGGGEVSIRWTGEEPPAGARVEGDAATATRARLLLTLLEPAHFGDGGAYGNHHFTRTFIPGSTVRGALAWTLLRNGRVQAEDAAFKALFLEEAAASFGDALLTVNPESDPLLFSATARKRRANGDIRNVLATELGRARINEALEACGQYLRADEGTDRFDPVEPRPVEGLIRHVRTRVSIDRWSGTAKEGRLFSIEEIDPMLASSRAEAEVRACFVSWVEGLTPAAAELLEKLRGLTVLIGAGRMHGLGLVNVDVRFESYPKEDPAEKVRRFAGTVNEKASELCRRAGIDPIPATLGRLPLALVALSDYVPSDRKISHPLAERELSSLGFSAPVRQFLQAGAAGGYDQHPQGAAPLKDLLPALGAGSVFVYDVAEADLPVTLDLMLPVLRRGLGRRIESGCGRFGLFELEAVKEKEMKSELSPGIKRWLVEQAETILDDAKPSKGQTSQLRNMLQIAQRESEIPVLRNFIRYQAGRKATRAFWGSIQKKVILVLEEIGNRFPGEDEKGVEARRSAIQSFFGYLVRHYVYLTEVGSVPPRNEHDPSARRVS